METIKTSKGTFLFVPVNRHGTIFFENMGYLIYDEPAYKNYVSDKILGNPFKLAKWLEKNEGKSDWKRAAVKLPDGSYKFMAVINSGLLDRHEASQNLTEEIASQIVGDNGLGCYDNYRLKKDEVYTCTTAMDSFNCLMLTSNLHTSDEITYAILKLK